MVEFARYDDPVTEIDAQIERLVDVKNLSYDDARRELGLPKPDNSDFTAEAIASRLGPAAMGAFKDDVELDLEVPEPHDGSNPKHGLNYRGWEKNSQTAEQKAQIQQGVETARSNIRPTRFGS